MSPSPVHLPLTPAQSEGDAINAAGTLVYPPEASGLQIGQGKYLSAKNNYPMSGTSVMYCRVRAPKARWDNVAKIWVPRSWAGNDLWWNPDRIDTYINTWGAGWTADRTIRLSLIDAPGLADTQLLVTPTLVSAGGALALTAQCYDTIDELGDTPDVNYDSWQSNIDGQRTDPNPPASLPPSQGGGYS